MVRPFENIAAYRQWPDQIKVNEIRTLLEDVATSWYIQQPDEVKAEWNMMKTLLIQNFANLNVTQTALQQLAELKQQPSEPVAQLLKRADPTMLEEMKLFFHWPRIRPNLARRIKDQGPVSFHEAVQVAQCIESAAVNLTLAPATLGLLPLRPTSDFSPTPMDVDIQNA